MRQRTLGLLAAALMLIGAAIGLGTGIAAQQMDASTPVMRPGDHPMFPGPGRPDANDPGRDGPGFFQPGGGPPGSGGTGP